MFLKTRKKKHLLSANTCVPVLLVNSVAMDCIFDEYCQDEQCLLDLMVAPIL